MQRDTWGREEQKTFRLETQAVMQMGETGMRLSDFSLEQRRVRSLRFLHLEQKKKTIGG